MIEWIENNITLNTILVYFVPLATLCMVIISTIANFFLWRETKFQSDLTVSPFLIFEIGDDGKFYIHNIGKNHAFNINMKGITLVVPVGGKKKIYECIAETIDLLGPGIKKELVFTSYSNKRIIDFNFQAHLNPRDQRVFNFPLTILYTNTIGRLYCTRFVTGKDGVKFKNIKRVGLYQRIRLLFERVIEYFQVKLF